MESTLQKLRQTVGKNENNLAKSLHIFPPNLEIISLQYIEYVTYEIDAGLSVDVIYLSRCYILKSPKGFR